MKRFASAPTGICIHHSATPDGRSRDTEAFRKYHIEQLGWDDIGYHYVVERIANQAPEIVSGRSLEYQGAHCPELNATHIGVCLAGNYDLAPPDAAMMAKLEELVRGLMIRYRIPASRIAYHCDYSPKSCPGSLFPKAGFILALAGEERPAAS